MYNVIANWIAENFACGGGFFTQTVFTLSSSVAFSSRIRDFLVVFKLEELENLQKRIAGEIRQGTLLEEQNQQYKTTLEKVDSVESSIKKWIARTVQFCQIYACVCMFVSFYLIASGCGEQVGCIPLVMLVPLWIARVVLKYVLIEKNKELASHSELFSQLQIAYQAAKRSDEQRVDTALAVALRSVPTKVRDARRR